MENPKTDHPITEAMFALLKTSLWGESRFPLPDLSSTDWEAVYSELRHHAIQNLVVDQLVKADPCHSQLYLKNALKGLSHWYRLMGEQQAACTLLQEADIPCAVLKGAAAAYAYPKNAHRSMGDIDLIVKPQDFEQAYDLISKDWEYIGESRRHKKLRRNGILLELHQAFSTANDLEKRALLDGWIFDAIGQAETVTMEGYSFPMLPSQIHGLVLLEHINVHMESGLGLRQIIDWMMFADQELTDAVWNGEFATKVRQLGLETLAVTVTRMCQLYLGLRSDLIWCGKADEALCHDLMAHTLKQGNFGRKLPKSYNKTISVLSTAKKGSALFRALQRYGCINWEAANKYPILRPFAWLYQICRYLRKGFQLKHPMRYLRDALKNEHNQDVLFDRLEITRMKNCNTQNKRPT